MSLKNDKLAAMQLDQVRVVLVSPIYGGNVGSVCRAMKNMGLRQLVIAEPRPEFDWAAARPLAAHADDILDARRIFPDLPSAVADCGLVAGTTARPGLYRSHAKTVRDWAPHLLASATAKQPVAILFGPEDNGLSNDHLKLCTQIIQIPSSPDYASINLAQAVMITAYELFVASGQFERPMEPHGEAPSSKREKMFEYWRQALLDIGFMEEHKADHMMMGLRRIFSRGPLTEADLRILMGIVRQTLWIAQQAKNAGVGPHPSRRRRPPPHARKKEAP